jgi:arylsulfatase A-like enzyme
MLGRENPLRSRFGAARRVARQSLWISPLVLLSPALVIVAFDLARRGGRLLELSPLQAGGYVLSTVAGGALWGSLLLFASRRRGVARHVAVAFFVLGATLALGLERYFHDQYATYLNLDALFFGLSFKDSLSSQLHAQLPSVARALLAPAVIFSAIAVFARHRLRPGPATLRRGKLVLAAAVVVGMLAPWSYRGAQAATPDVLFLHAVAGYARAATGLLEAEAQALPGHRSPEYLPSLTARPARPRNVVFVLTESVRADVVCTAHDPACRSTPFTNRAAKDRLPLLQMRANDSVTAVSVAVLLTGLSPAASRETVHSAPMLWEYARAAGYDTAYWTSQDLRFGNSDMFVRDVGAMHHVAGAELDPEADLDLGARDAYLTDHVERELAALREPFVAVLHYSNTHFPYFVEEGKSPFSPAELTKDPEKGEAFFNHYRNAVFLQDEAIGRAIDAVRKSAFSERTVIVYTSDHGEAFREHTQMGHTLSLYDEEIHVPAWIDAPPATLSDEERRAVESLRDRPTFHVDLLPTFLDLLGVHDAAEIGRQRDRFAGTSLLRARGEDAPVPLTNCAALWTCPFETWGMMRGALKLEARAWDREFHCWDVIQDPEERHDLGPSGCGDLPDRAVVLFGGKPGQRR